MKRSSNILIINTNGNQCNIRERDQFDAVYLVIR